MKKMREKIQSLFQRFVSFVLGKPRPGTGSGPRPWLDHYDKDVPPTIHIPEITLNELFQRSVDYHRQQKAFVYYGTQFTYGELEKLVTGAAAGLLQLGLRKGDRLALLLPNTPQYIIAYWAALRIGLIVAPINPLLSPPEVETQLKLARPRAILILDQLYNRNKEAISHAGILNVIHTAVDSFMPSVTRFVYFIKSGFGSNEKNTWSHLLSFDRLYVANATVDSQHVRPDDGAVLLFTGGVTGSPKAVFLQHRQLVANVMQTRMWMGEMRDGQEIILGVLPFFHSYGMTACHHLAVQLGAMLVLEPRFKVQRIIRLCSRYRVTIFPGVPTMYKAIARALAEKGRRLKQISVCISGGAPLSATLKREFEAVTDSRLVEGYGLTEASPLTHCNPLKGKNRAGSIGLPCPNTDARIVDLQTGQPLPANETGELQVKGPQVMTGYWQNEKATAEVLQQGWLSTGDIAQMDEDGFFYLVDRKKDLILSGGLNVYPSEIEKVLNQHPAVDDCAVIGVPDDFWGEAAKAFVVLYPGAHVTADDLNAFCKARLAAYKRPKHYIFVETLPRNFIGKIIRRQLHV